MIGFENYYGKGKRKVSGNAKGRKDRAMMKRGKSTQLE
jgi:hypothetical protein